MQNFVTVLVILGLISVGVLLINRLNGQHDERIAAFRYSRTAPGAGDRTAGRAETPPADRADEVAGTRRDHRDGGRGRSSQRRRAARGHGYGHGRGAAKGGRT
ncbi:MULTISPECIES: hypothetical protein [unclassified Streptomyces]|uniref:hypothetical protein n=1 Tax=unclassified Streptomyces TaxID=2593676 RepID=UPI002E27EB2D|nr:hypothetical protein [Streptomyces sp. NBC_00223]